jgi:hypothetical protein
MPSPARSASDESSSWHSLADRFTPAPELQPSRNRPSTAAIVPLPAAAGTPSPPPALGRSSASAAFAPSRRTRLGLTRSDISAAASSAAADGDDWRACLCSRGSTGPADDGNACRGCGGGGGSAASTCVTSASLSAASRARSTPRWSSPPFPAPPSSSDLCEVVVPCGCGCRPPSGDSAPPSHVSTAHPRRVLSPGLNVRPRRSGVPESAPHVPMAELMRAESRLESAGCTEAPRWLISTVRSGLCRLMGGVVWRWAWCLGVGSAYAAAVVSPGRYAGPVAVASAWPCHPAAMLAA